MNKTKKLPVQELKEMLKIGDKVKMNDKYYVSEQKEQRRFWFRKGL